jgi:hypothetical protein
VPGKVEAAAATDLAQWSELIKAIAALLWPLSFIGLLILLYYHRKDLSSLAGRVTKMKLFGQELELTDLRQDLDRLSSQSQAVTNEAAAAPEQASPDAEQVEKQDRATKEILVEAGRSPKAALLLLSAQLESGLRRLLQATGRHEGRPSMPLAKAVRQLQGVLPPDFPSAFELFQAVRNKIAHGYRVPDEDVLRAIDSGVKLLEVVGSVPREVNKVHATGIDLYSDAALTNLVDDAKGLILETSTHDGVSRGLRIFPTTLRHFERGKEVSWEWNMGRQWGPTWYRDPATSLPRQAWVGSAEFIGRHLDDY